MDIHFKVVNEDTIDDAKELKVLPQQNCFIETVMESYIEAKKRAFWKPIIILDAKEYIGFAMYGLFEEENKENQLWLDRFFIDYRYQGKGYAKRVMVLLLAKMKEEYGNLPIYLSVYKENILAIKIYQSLGFVFTKQLDVNGELIMILNIK